MPTYTRPIQANLLASGLVGTLGYRVYDAAGSPLTARITAGIAEDGSSGIYLASVANWDTAWSGSIAWDAGFGTLAREPFIAYAPQSGDSFARIGVDGAGLTAIGDTRLANLDAAVSSRFATTGYTAPTNADTSGVTTLLARLTSVRAGNLDNLDAAITSRMATFAYTAPLDAAEVRSAVGLASANLDGQLAAIDDFLDTEVAAIKAKTDTLPSAFPDNFGLLVINGSGYITTSNPATGGSTVTEATLTAYMDANSTKLANLTGPVALAATALSSAVWTDAKAAFIDAAISGGSGGGGADLLATPVPGAYASGTVGNILGNLLSSDEAGDLFAETPVAIKAGGITTASYAAGASVPLPASPPAAYATATGITNLGIGIASVGTSVGGIAAVLGSPAGGTFAAAVAAVKTDTGKVAGLVETASGVDRFKATALATAPTGSGGGADPLDAVVPGAYASGTAGFVLGNILTADEAGDLIGSTPVTLPATPPAGYATASGISAVSTAVAGVKSDTAAMAPTIAAIAAQQVAGMVASATTTSVVGAAGLSAINNFYAGSALVFTSGSLQGRPYRIAGYAGSSRTFTFDAGVTLPVAPSAGATFNIVGLIPDAD